MLNKMMELSRPLHAAMRKNMQALWALKRTERRQMLLTMEDPSFECDLSPGGGFCDVFVRRHVDGKSIGPIALRGEQIPVPENGKLKVSVYSLTAESQIQPALYHASVCTSDREIKRHDKVVDIYFAVPLAAELTNRFRIAELETTQQSTQTSNEGLVMPKKKKLPAAEITVAYVKQGDVRKIDIEVALSEKATRFDLELKHITGRTIYGTMLDAASGQKWKGDLIELLGEYVKETTNAVESGPYRLLVRPLNGKEEYESKEIDIGLDEEDVAAINAKANAATAKASPDAPAASTMTEGAKPPTVEPAPVVTAPAPKPEAPALAQATPAPETKPIAVPEKEESAFDRPDTSLGQQMTDSSSAVLAGPNVWFRDTPTVASIKSYVQSAHRIVVKLTNEKGDLLKQFEMNYTPNGNPLRVNLERHVTPASLAKLEKDGSSSIRVSAMAKDSAGNTSAEESDVTTITPELYAWLSERVMRPLQARPEPEARQEPETSDHRELDARLAKYERELSDLRRRMDNAATKDQFDELSGRVDKVNSKIDALKSSFRDSLDTGLKESEGRIIAALKQTVPASSAPATQPSKPTPAAAQKPEREEAASKKQTKPDKRPTTDAFYGTLGVVAVVALVMAIVMMFLIRQTPPAPQTPAPAVQANPAAQAKQDDHDRHIDRSVQVWKWTAPAPKSDEKAPEKEPVAEDKGPEDEMKVVGTVPTVLTRKGSCEQPRPQQVVCETTVVQSAQPYPYPPYDYGYVYPSVSPFWLGRTIFGRGHDGERERDTHIVFVNGGSRGSYCPPIRAYHPRDGGWQNVQRSIPQGPSQFKIPLGGSHNYDRPHYANGYFYPSSGFSYGSHRR